MELYWYSGVPIMRAGCNKQAGRKFHENSLKQVGCIRRAGWNLSEIPQNEQAAIRHEQGVFEDYFTSHSKIYFISTVFF